MTYRRKAKSCPFGLIPEEDVCGKHPHCIAHKEPVSTCPERGKGKPAEPLAELERLRAYVEELEATCDDCNWKCRTNEAEAEMERLRGRVAVLEEALKAIALPASNYNYKDGQFINWAHVMRETAQAALAQAEGDTP